MRSALLQLPGNPFILRYWLRNYEAVWKGEVDELRVFVNGNPRADQVQAMRRLVQDTGGIFTAQEGRLVHGQATRILIGETEATDVLLIEDDAFVRQPGAIDRAFVDAECGAVVGSPRGGMDPAIEQAARDKWGPDPEGPDGSSGYGLWPCFMFGPRHVLDEVKDGFSSQSWPAGQVIPGLGCWFGFETHTDTTTSSAFRLREAGIPLVYEGQWKELWMKDLSAMQEKAGYDPPWFHSGGLSNENLYLVTEVPEGAFGVRPNIGGTLEGTDWAHRIWWWRRCIETAPDDFFPEVGGHILNQLLTLENYCNVFEDVDRWEQMLPAWITWEE